MTDGEIRRQKRKITGQIELLRKELWKLQNSCPHRNARKHASFSEELAIPCYDCPACGREVVGDDGPGKPLTLLDE